MANATEYGAGNMVSAHGDIYSYGILVLETITGNRPTDSRFREGLSLREFVVLALRNRTMDAVDTRLSVEPENELHTIGDSSSYKRKTDCIASLQSIGVSCTQELPSSRMSTEGIIKELLAVKNSLQREHRA
jgi:serine/threonine protein kinase